ncbi:Transporter, folate-biopterin transporter [Zostera marina]|uniref:Transporter, folate-biopterin transporter n=1 Tax=Zostera marina TaxID=29655 RepID=A0A0K9PEH1_ZOSMR|nr:Transporter, folate-biopterin transporter [Zostera marina]
MDRGRRGRQRRARPAPTSPPNNTGAEDGPRASTNDWWILDIGSSVQGFRCFPNMAVNFFLKDGLRVSPSTAQILQNSTNLPMIGKPIYGVLSDAIGIRGEHRLPYIAIGVLLQVISWLSIIFLPPSCITKITLTMFLLLGNVGASIVDVAHDAIAAEVGRHTNSTGKIQAMVLSFSSVTGILGNLLGGVALSKTSTSSMFSIFAVILTVQFLVIISISENSLSLPARMNSLSSSVRIRQQFSQLWNAICIPEVASSIGWLAISFSLVPVLFGTMFYYQTSHLKLDSSVIAMSKVLGQIYLLIWSLTYEKWLKKIPPRKLFMYLQGSVVTLMLCDFAFVQGFFRCLGIPDPVYVILLSGLIEVMTLQFKNIPFNVLFSRLCPVGCEGSLVAFVMSITAMTTMISSYLGVALAKWAVVSGDEFSGISLAITVQIICAAVPISIGWWIPDKSDIKFAKLINDEDYEE